MKNARLALDSAAQGKEANNAAGKTDSNWLGRQLPVTRFLDSSGGLANLADYHGNKNLVQGHLRPASIETVLAELQKLSFNKQDDWPRFWREDYSCLTAFHLHRIRALRTACG